MKKKIIITENQYKKIFLSGDYDTIILEQVQALIRKINNVIKRQVIDDTLQSSLKKLFVGLADDSFESVGKLLDSLNSKGVNKLNPKQIKGLMKIESLKDELMNILSVDPEIKKLLTLRSTAMDLSNTHPSIKKIDNILVKYMDVEDLPEFIEMYEKSGLNLSSMSSQASSYSKGKLKDIFTNLKTESEVLDWMKKNNQDLMTLTANSNNVNLLSSKQRDLWYNISKDLNDKWLPKLKTMDDEILKNLKNADIDPSAFKKKLLSTMPGNTKQFFLNLYYGPLGQNKFGRYIIYLIMVAFSTSLIYPGYKIYDWITNITKFSGSSEKSSEKISEKIQKLIQDDMLDTIKDESGKEIKLSDSDIEKNSLLSLESDFKIYSKPYGSDKNVYSITISKFQINNRLRKNVIFIYREIDGELFSLTYKGEESEDSVEDGKIEALNKFLDENNYDFKISTNNMMFKLNSDNKSYTPVATKDIQNKEKSEVVIKKDNELNLSLEFIDNKWVVKENE